MSTPLIRSAHEMKETLPEELLRVPLSKLLITQGSLGKMHRIGVTTVGQFLTYPPANMLKLKAVGVRTLNAILDELEKLRRAGSLLPYHFPGGEVPSSPKAFASHILTALEKDEYQVMVFRYGLGISRKHTLSAIGEIKELSRERVRQRESKNLQYLNRIFGPYITEYIETIRKGQKPDQMNVLESGNPESRYVDLLFAVADAPK